MKYNDNGEWKDIQVKVANAIQNEYGESNNDGYSQNYLNGLNEYSTTEHRVGTWIDGKPIYRKVIDFGAFPNATTKNVYHNINNLGFITKLYGISFVSSWGTYIQIPYVVAGSEKIGDIQLTATSDFVQIKTGSDRSIFTNNYIILEYTKTTDTVSTRNVETRNIVVDDNDDEGEIVRGEET